MILMLKHNGRWHPAMLIQIGLRVWRLGPYHTEGFANRSEAIKSIEDYLVRRVERVYGDESAITHLERDHSWDGEKNQAQVKLDSFGLICIEWLDELYIPMVPEGVTIVLI